MNAVLNIVKNKNGFLECNVKKKRILQIIKVI